MIDEKAHWDRVYQEKKATEMSWYEPLPEHSMALIEDCKLQKDAPIIDIGGGDAYLAEYLLARGYTDVTVLDISERALDRAKRRLGDSAGQIKWIAADITEFEPERQYELWHDRATFHFLLEPDKISGYLEKVKQSVRAGGHVVLGTFSDKGPKMCSGLQIRQYSVGQIRDLFGTEFVQVHAGNFDHTTPSGQVQNFSFCSFEKQ